MERRDVWVPASLLKAEKRKKDYIPSHKRKGFKESAVIKLPTHGQVQKAPGSQFVISRDKPLYKDRGK